MAPRPGRRGVRDLQLRLRPLLAYRGAGLRAGRRRRPVAARCLPNGHRAGEGRAGDQRGVPLRQGVGWHEHHHDLFSGCERFFRPNYSANLTSSWIPALDGVEEKLATGASVADFGCGFGTSTVLMARAYPRSTFVGFDYHEASIQAARKAAAEAGVADRCRFEVATAKDYPGGGYDLVTVFDALHDMGDPVGAAAHVRETLAPDGTWMLVEPYAGDTTEGNLNPVGRIYYSASTLACVPASLAQEVGLALGAQAGEARLREVVIAGGFSRFRRAAETPFNLVFEARR